MKSVLIIPRFPGGPFAFVGDMLCKFLVEKGFKCKVGTIGQFINEVYDTLIFVGNTNDSSLLRALPLSIFSRRRIFYAVTECPYYGYLKCFERRFNIVAPSRYVYLELKGSGIRVRDIIPHGIDIEEFQNDYNVKNNEIIQKLLKLRSNDYIILLSIISENIPRKGLSYLYEALRNIKTRKRFKVVIRGHVDVPNDLLDKVLIIREFLPREILIGLYKLSDVVIVPSLAEGFGLPVIEAFAAGKPVVSLNVMPMNELNDEKTGYLIRVCDQKVIRGWPTSFRLNIPCINDYVNKLTEAIEDEDSKFKKSTNALEKAVAYDYRRTYKSFLRILDD
jgi:glycosyltransferase involved in cell wall biosynthesis